ncbi:peptidoglycan-binding domain-containing protein [Acidovorax carolinensis]|nr:peptidoglycan-binding domain-containing protein [Acidovorax carolinensis]
MNKLLIAATLAGAAFASGCAPLVSGAMNAAVDENAIQEKTAKYFAVEPGAFSIFSVEKGALTTAYKVNLEGRIYNCSIYYGDVDCKHVRTESMGNRRVEPVAEKSAKQGNEGSSMTPAQAQTRLNQLGYQVGAADGVFGKRSIEKLKMFQKARGLAVTGQLDTPTVEALNNR